MLKINTNQATGFYMSLGGRRNRCCHSSSSNRFSKTAIVAATAFVTLASRSTTMTTTTVRAFGNLPSQRFDYEPPSWTKDVLTNPPKHGRLQLANLPTPIHKLPSSKNLSILKDLLPADVNLYVKRDDMTGGVETGGNKIRKLEFLLADALAQHYDSVVTIGGEQSNHCRATASASRMVGLKPNLILRTKRADAIQRQKILDAPKNGSEIGIVGNVLYDRMVGSTIFTCTPGEYGRIGSQQLVARVCQHLEQDSGNKPYPIPVGGSNGIGTWGYIEGVKELLEQWKTFDGSLDHIVFACGSGGTAAGIALGIALAHSSSSTPNEQPHVHAIGVCDNPDYFYQHCAMIAAEMGYSNTKQDAESFLRAHMSVYHGKGLGYAVSTEDELEFIKDFALDTGIVLDPVYSGKALYKFVNKELVPNKEKYQNQNILFWHTGESNLVLCWPSYFLTVDLFGRSEFQVSYNLLFFIK